MGIRIEGHRIWRGVDKIGYVEGHSLYNEDGHKVAFWSDDDIYDSKSGDKIASIKGNRVYDRSGDERHLDDMIENIPSSTLSEPARVAIKTFFGD